MTTQLAPAWRGKGARNSSADANIRDCQPADSISNSNDSRTDTSSSTMNTVGLAEDIVRTSKKAATTDGRSSKSGQHRRSNFRRIIQSARSRSNVEDSDRRL